jgi:hypothetical protein
MGRGPALHRPERTEYFALSGVASSLSHPHGRGDRLTVRVVDPRETVWLAVAVGHPSAAGTVARTRYVPGPMESERHIPVPTGRPSRVIDAFAGARTTSARREMIESGTGFRLGAGSGRRAFATRAAESPPGVAGATPPRPTPVAGGTASAFGLRTAKATPLTAMARPAAASVA